jgi:hypothetical protein
MEKKYVSKIKNTRHFIYLLFIYYLSKKNNKNSKNRSSLLGISQTVHNLVHILILPGRLFKRNVGTNLALIYLGKIIHSVKSAWTVDLTPR